jgi:KEOPS complex subunit Cgi121
MSHMIVGARGRIEDPESAVRRLQEWSRAHHAVVLAADARTVFGRDHLESAVRHAERAQASNRMGARTLAIETLLYVAGKRQVVDAIRVAGLRKGTRAIALVLWGVDDPDDLLSSLGWTRDDTVIEPAGKSLEVLGVTERERGTVTEAAVADLALEKVALLDVSK